LIRDERSADNAYDLHYDSHQRLVGISHDTEAGANYTQNGLGQRVIKTSGSPATTRHYHYDLSGRLLAESTDQGQVIREYLYRDDQLVGLINEGALYYVHTDHLGTPQLITDGSQQVVWASDYLPFGEATVTVNQLENPIRFPGQYYDAEMGTNYNYYRNYDPSLGRYIQSDPIGLEGGLNRYGYADNSPLVYIDPLGLWSFSIELYRGIGGGIVIGKNNSTRQWFWGGKLGIGMSAGFGFDALNNGPTEDVLRPTPYSDPCASMVSGTSGTSWGGFADIGANFGKYGISYGGRGGQHFNGSHGHYHSDPGLKYGFNALGRKGLSVGGSAGIEVYWW
jgi:RHS repeat-associated protein